jgi:hypothetical protein
MVLVAKVEPSSDNVGCCCHWRLAVGLGVVLMAVLGVLLLLLVISWCTYAQILHAPTHSSSLLLFVVCHTQFMSFISNVSSRMTRHIATKNWQIA